MTRRFSRGFTLMEMLVVIAIIGILAGLLLPALSAAREQARKRTARVEAGQLETALRAFFTDNRGWGSGLPATSSSSLVKLLLGDSGNKVPYMEFGSRNLVDGQMVDPWGNPYRVAYCDNNNTINANGETVYRVSAVWSLGPDGKSGTDDDVCSWK